MSDFSLTDTPQRKAARRDPVASRKALIDATLDTIAESGLAEASVTNIIRRAELSRGMVHLHFGGKDNLVTAAAQQFSNHYYSEMDRMIDIGDAPPAVRVMAVVVADLSETLLNPRSTKIWHAFRGAANAHPGIAKYSSTQDERLVQNVRFAFEEIAREQGGSDTLAEDATYGTLALLEGMWVHYLTDMENFSRPWATELVRRFLAGLFPNHFCDPATSAENMHRLILSKSPTGADRGHSTSTA